MPETQKPSWFFRNTATFLLLLTSLGVIAYVVGWGDDTVLHRQMGLFAWVTAFLTVGGYTGIAALEDIQLAKILGVVK